MSRTVRPDKGDPERPSAIQRELATASDPTPENVLAGLEVQEKSLRELRRYLFTRLFQLQVRASRSRALALPPPRRLRRADPPPAAVARTPCRRSAGGGGRAAGQAPGAPTASVARIGRCRRLSATRKNSCTSAGSAASRRSSPPPRGVSSGSEGATYTACCVATRCGSRARASSRTSSSACASAAGRRRRRRRACPCSPTRSAPAPAPAPTPRHAPWWCACRPRRRSTWRTAWTASPCTASSAACRPGRRFRTRVAPAGRPAALPRAKTGPG